MHFSLSIKLPIRPLRAIACLFLSFHLALANAGGTDHAMRAALGDLVVARNMEASLDEVLAELQTNGLAFAREAARRKMTDELGMPEAEQAQTMALLDQLLPQMVERLRAEVGGMDKRAFLVDLLEAVYPAYFSTEEVRALVALYAHPAYDTAAAVVAQVDEEHERTGKDPALLWKQLGAPLSAEELRFAQELQASPLLHKLAERQAQLEADFGAAFGRRVRPVLARAFDDTYAAVRARLAAGQAK